MHAPIHSRSKYIVLSQVQLTNILQLLGALHVFSLLAVESHDLSQVEKEISTSKVNSQNDNYFHSKSQPRTILSENSCHL